MTLFLGTGCGRSGTLWTARFFTELGFPALHERQFSPTRQLPFKASEVSWLAVPFLDTLPVSTRLLRIVRDPYAAVISGMQMEFQRHKRGTEFDRFLATHRPDIVEPEDKLTRIIRWVALWDMHMDSTPHMVVRPDIDPLDRLGEVFEYATGVWVAHGRIARVCADLGKQINTKQTTVTIGREEIDAHPEGWRIRKRAERFGYV